MQACKHSTCQNCNITLEERIHSEFALLADTMLKRVECFEDENELSVTIFKSYSCEYTLNKSLEWV